MSVWLHYWRPKDVKEFFTISKFRVDCTGSNQSTFLEKYEKGDTVWFHTILKENKQHIVLGRIVLDNNLPMGEAMEFVGRPFSSKFIFDSYWVAERPWNKIKQIPLGDTPLKWNFTTNKPLPVDYNGLHFRTIRGLTEEDHNHIQEIWDTRME